MKVYIIFDQEGWEILGIEKCFDEKEKAELYLEPARANFMSFKNKTFEQWRDEVILEVNVE